MSVTVERPYLPPRLYRYRNLGNKGSLTNREIDPIISGYIWCSTYDAMNDPMEGYFTPREFRTGGPEDYQDILDEIRYNATELGLACFSETYESELMWAHYAGNYSGICIGYSTKDLIAGLQGNVYLARISYVDEPPKLSIMQFSDRAEAARIVLSLKKSNWAYEHEWRLIGTIGRNLISTQAVRTINFGARVSKPVRKQFMSSLHSLNIKYYQMTVSGYKHAWSSEL